MIPTDKPTEAMIEELRRRVISKPVTEYGRGWNCGLEEAEDLIRRSSAPQEPDDDALIEELRELKKGWVTSKSFSKFIDRVIDRLQAKAPETGEE